ncbi:GTP-binding protein REM 2 isoform X1 [Pseudoliparis swirei]|uniref:GTP-binding protein REM 2 isoform X1 n=1 Tax=Pseudoliparis swirei TaxID=2059687 RepID=UPI0024BEB637|nr:GTP-binding protein REM 2 isoform X1 [Pseudoliparis swirei]
MADQYSMFLTTAPPLRRGSTPLPLKHQLRREEAVSEDCDWIPGVEEPALLPIGGTGLTRDDSGSQSAAGQSAYHSHGGALKIVLLGQNGVGKSSLALSLAGQSDRSLSVDSCGEGYECSVTVDDEDSKVVIFDNWKQDFSTLHSDVCILVFSVTDRRSFHRIAQLRLLLRESQPHTDHPGGQQERPCALPGNQRRRVGGPREEPRASSPAASTGTAPPASTGTAPRASSPGPGVSTAPPAQPSSSGRVLTDAVLQNQRDTLAAVHEVARELGQIRHVLGEICTCLKDIANK